MTLLGLLAGAVMLGICHTQDVMVIDVKTQEVTTEQAIVCIVPNVIKFDEERKGELM